MNNNTINTLFEMASQMKFRYPFRGMITTEDLWDLKGSELDIVYQNLNKELNDNRGDSLITNIDTEQAVKVNEIKNKIEIVKYIFEAKEQAAALARTAAENTAKRNHILAILAKKQDDALENMSEEELQQMLNELG